MLVSPYAIWYSQEAKVYSLWLFVSTMFVWLLLRAARRNEGRDWLLVAMLALVALFIHRLSALLLVAGVWAWVARWVERCVAAKERNGTQRIAQPYPLSRNTGEGAGGEGQRGHPKSLSASGSGVCALAFTCATLLSLGLVAALVDGLGGEQAAGRAAAGAAIPADPLLALGLTFVRFSLDRWPGDLVWWWLVPWVLLTAWGVVRLLADLRNPVRRMPAATLLILLFVPLALFLAQLSFTRLYEARYLTAIFPVWVLVVGYALGVGFFGEGKALPKPLPRAIASSLLLCALITSGLALTQPSFGIFSGDAVKEQYREAVAELAARVHPDDAIVIHPSYLAPLYYYYMAQLSDDPAPEPILFGDFWQGETAFGPREWDIERQARLAGYTRSWLLIAPEHARTVDRPLAGDEYGLVGLFWAYSSQQRAWPCGIWRYNGAHLLCQESPEAYVTGERPTPATPVGATFGDTMILLGYTLKATTPAGTGVYRAGGNLPLSLFWDVVAPPGRDYSLFLHLCQRCDEPPAASEDGPPLEGYLPTSTWLPGKPARDDRAIALPPDLAPGRYTLLLGLYDPNDPSAAGRLSVTHDAQIGAGRLVLGTVEIVGLP
ncbi:MAG: hypothetical protein EI684_03715 [Candidatus Viridilinea halotolerans]|uniref:Glycosyltransferase RgtA/B/C/D-like domain-containing protein n=1 Tax=Candidatus Viridilinea halotolerans TaxID=2491704 RepID=A0A426U798_9CHLR|nr:MAG: hypothetical protein EI684_03715 [Candidatus Viridilinea halotolerans]